MLFHEYEKARLVAKLKGARHGARRQCGECERRKSYAEGKPELVALAKQLRRELLRPSLREISGALFARGLQRLSPNPRGITDPCTTPKSGHGPIGHRRLKGVKPIYRRPNLTAALLTYGRSIIDT